MAKGPKTSIITLSTDFGWKDPYVGVMKGVILGINPRVHLVDLTHALSPHRLLEAAFILEAAAPYFPAETIHLAVVDPGVGGERRLLVLQSGKHFWVGPDNGIFTKILQKNPETRVFQLNNPNYRLTEVSYTFHGRDILSPAAAHLSLGVPPAEFGPQIADPVQLPIPEPRILGDRVVGQVLWADHFGNLVTNIHRRILSPSLIEEKARVRLGDNLQITGIRKCYSEASPQTLLALFGSWGYLEIACNLGRADQAAGYTEGEALKIEVFPF